MRKTKTKSLHNGQQSQTRTVHAATIQTCMLTLIHNVPEQTDWMMISTSCCAITFPPLCLPTQMDTVLSSTANGHCLFINNNKN